MEIFVPDYEWNAHYNTVEESVEAGFACGDFKEGDEFKMVRLTVGACTTYKIVDGKPVPVAVSFPAGLPSNALAQADAACGVSPGAMGSASLYE